MKQQISYQMDDGLNVTGLIPVNYDNFVFSDIEEKIILKNSNIDVHYNYVLSTLGDSYEGINKYEYGNILQAIKAIVYCKNNHLKSPVRAKAIAFLHQEMKFSPSTIQRILFLFGVNMEITKILKDSQKIFSESKVPQWVQRFFGGVI